MNKLPLVTTVIRGIEVEHHPDDPPELVEEMAACFLGAIRYRQQHPNEEGYEFWQHYVGVELEDAEENEQSTNLHQPNP